MTPTLEQFIKSLEDSGVLASETLADFVPPKASPKGAEELARELLRHKKLTKFQAERLWLGHGKSLVLGNYVLVDKIGQGGMGAVYKAEHRRMKRVVAVKMLPAAMLNDSAAAARFQREVEAAGKLRHPNIVAADDADEANGVHFLVMECVEGTDLSVLVKKTGPLPVAQAVHYILQAARGLEFAHKKGIVHRDIKPGNLLVDREGTVKILDMGLARIQGDTATQAELTGTGAVMGTVDYMAPEQALSTKHAAAPADIYSLGCSLFYLLTGNATYAGETLTAKLLAHQNMPIPALRSFRADVPEPLEAIFRKMVAKQIDDRYQTMTEVIADLEKCVGQQAVSLQPALESSDANLTSFLNDISQAKIVSITSRPAPSIPASRKKRFLMGAGGVAGLLFLGLIVFSLSSKRNLVTTDVNSAGSSTDLASQESAAKKKPSKPVRPANAPPPAIAPFGAVQAHEHQAAWARYLGTKVKTRNSVGISMTLIPPGEFLMGTSPAELELVRKMGQGLEKLVAPEQPQHRVVITRPFRMSETEVTVGAFRKFAAAKNYKTDAEMRAKNAEARTYLNPGCSMADDMPVTHISWDDADKFCRWLSEQEKTVYRLPTEAEWEYACRAGTRTLYSFGDDGKKISDYGWFKDNVTPNGTLGRVGEKLSNPFGLHDVHGNVWEWCQDFYDPKAYEKSSVNDPTGPASGIERVLRGGYEGYRQWNWRSAIRMASPPTSAPARHWSGFRLVRMLDDGSPDSDTARAAQSAADLPAVAIAPFDAPQARAHQEAWAKSLGIKVETIHRAGGELRLIPPGEFEMGSTTTEIEKVEQAARDSQGDALQFVEYYKTEAPRHFVRITRPFYLGATEVTVAEYDRFLVAGGKPARGGNANLPVGDVSWDDAVAFCRWLGRNDRHTYRLPTEAEWEYACRAGTTTPFSFGEGLSSDYANFDGNFPYGTTEAGPFLNQPTFVGKYPANPFGLFDMHGNQWEWCQDYFGRDYYQISEKEDPQGAAAQGQHVLRGGDWQASHALTCRSAQRYEYSAPFASVGFRVVREIDGPLAKGKRRSK